jgi:hypothetical protein
MTRVVLSMPKEMSINDYQESNDIDILMFLDEFDDIFSESYDQM